MNDNNDDNPSDFTEEAIKEVMKAPTEEAPKEFEQLFYCWGISLSQGGWLMRRCKLPLSVLNQYSEDFNKDIYPRSPQTDTKAIIIGRIEYEMADPALRRKEFKTPILPSVLTVKVKKAPGRPPSKKTK